jgi:hypothetical protein
MPILEGVTQYVFNSIETKDHITFVLVHKMRQSITKGRNRKGKRPNTERAKIDAREIQNVDRYWSVTSYIEDYIGKHQLGDKLTKPLVTRLAQEVSARAFPPIRIDRMARRAKTAMICWFCEHENDTTDVLDGWAASGFDPDWTMESDQNAGIDADWGFDPYDF